jgi:uncharacterized protein YwgA
MINETDLQRQAAVLSLIDALRKNSSWCGETHVQKSAFFLQILSEAKLGYDFSLYKHGPYSFELRSSLSVMATLKYIQSDVIDSRYGAQISPTPAGEKILMQRYGSLAKELEPIIAYLAVKFGNKGVKDLERVSTALYFTKVDPMETVLDRARAICSVKPHIEERLAVLAVEEVDNILREWGG